MTCTSILGLCFDFGEDNVDVGGREVLVKKFDVASEFGQLRPVHQSWTGRSALVTAEGTERLEHVLHSLPTIQYNTCYTVRCDNVMLHNVRLSEVIVRFSLSRVLRNRKKLTN